LTPLCPLLHAARVKQLFSTKRGQVVVMDAPAPTCGDDQLLVATAWSVISAGTETRPLRATTSERVAQRRSWIKRGLEVLQEDGIRTLRRKITDMDNIQRPLGYSCAGVVLEVGKAVQGFSVGDRVACAGAGHACHAEVNQIPPLLACRIPDDVSLEDAAWTTIGAIALQGIRRAQPALGETVVVTGLGLLGLLSVQMAHAAGCRVVALDLDPERIERAKALGAAVALDARDENATREALDALTGGIGADAVLLTASTSSNDPLQQALRLVRQRGRVVIVGDVGLEMTRSPFYEKEAEVTISCSYGPGRYDPDYEEGGLDYPPGFVRWTENRNMEAFLQLLAQGRIDVATLTTDRFPIADAEQAMHILVAPRSTSLGVTLHYPAAESSPDVRTSLPIHSNPIPSDVIRLGVIGAGGFAGAVHLPNVESHDDLLLTHVVARTSTTSTRQARTFHAARASTDWRAPLEDDEVDAVLIATRHDTHAAFAAAALRAGKHVLLEKPLGLTTAEVEDVLAAQKEKGAVLVVGHNRRFSPAAIQLREAIASWNTPGLIHVRVNAGAIPATHWTQDPEIGGGRIIGELCHFLDLCNHLVGDAVEITRWDAMLIPVDGRQIVSLDNVSVQIEYANGFVANLVYTASGSTQLAKERVEVFCAGRSVVLDDFRSMNSHGTRPLPQWSGRQNKGHKDQLDAFVAAIRGNPGAIPPLDSTERSARLAIAIDKALRTPPGEPPA